MLYESTIRSAVAPGAAKARPITKYIYGLRLRNGLLYVGSTQNLNRRLREHFALGGASATRKSRPVRLELLFAFDEPWHSRGSNLERLEVQVASLLAKRWGADQLRGALRGCGHCPYPCDDALAFVRRTKVYFQTKAGMKLWASLRRVLPSRDGPSPF